MAAVSGGDFDMTGEWAMLGMLIDSMFVLLCIMSTAPICHLVML